MILLPCFPCHIMHHIYYELSSDFSLLKITSRKLTKITFSFYQLQLFVFLRSVLFSRQKSSMVGKVGVGPWKHTLFWCWTTSPSPRLTVSAFTTQTKTLLHLPYIRLCKLYCRNKLLRDLYKGLFKPYTKVYFCSSSCQLQTGDDSNS